MKFLIIGDLHGVMPNVFVKDFDAIIAPGDLCSDKGIREVYMKMYNKYVKNVDDYENWWDIIGKKKAKKYTVNSLNAGRKILTFLSSFDKPIFLVPGNWDWADKGEEDWKFMNKNFWKDYVIKGIKNIHDVDGRLMKFTKSEDVIENVIFLGYGRCNGPELLKYRGYGGITKKEIVRNQNRFKKRLIKLDNLFKRAKKSNLPILFINHNVPYNTKLDTIKNKKSPLNGKHYGSILARRMIDKHQPLVSIGGHMHEHFGKDRIKKTLVLNSGFGAKVNTILEIKHGKVKSVKFYDGKKWR